MPEINLQKDSFSNIMLPLYLDNLELKLLIELKRIVEGGDSDQASAERAKNIIKLASAVENTGRTAINQG